MDETPCPLNTRKRFCISIVVLVLNITLRPIPIIAQRSAEPPSVEKQAKSPSQPRKNADGTDNVPDNDLRGTDTSPITVKILPTINTKEETAQEQQAQQDQSSANWWMVRLTALLGVIGFIQTIVFGVQALRLRETIRKMEEIAQGQTEDMKASIGEATRAATAMEGIATSLVSSVQSARESIGITREIADRQKTIMELGGRAYLYAGFSASVYQDANHVFEANAFLVNRGSTPAYDVTFRASVDILPFPIPNDFGFPLPDETAGISVSLIAPGMTKILTRPLLRRVPDDEVDAIKQGGPPQCFVMWGIVNYRDAFNEPRYLKFAFKMHWIGWVIGMDRDNEGNPKPPQMMSEDTNRHNEAN